MHEGSIRSHGKITAYHDSGEYTPRIERRHKAVLAEVARIRRGVGSGLRRAHADPTATPASSAA
jgi:hypothetical protein